MKNRRYFLLGVVLGITGTAAPAAAQEAEPAAGEAESGLAGQPFDFPHDVHAGENQIDCQYCHFSAERSMNAGIPAIANCMGCHAFVSGSEDPGAIETLRGYAERGEAIAWDRTYKVADHVQFPHMRHIAAGVECASCHGNVQEIRVIEEVDQPLTMGFCVGCHIEQGASRDCTVCHY